MSTRVGNQQDTITQIDEALHRIRARLAALESQGGSGGTSIRLSDDVPLSADAEGDAGDDTTAARGDHVHPAVRWTEIVDRPEIADATYRHVQMTPASVWTVAHALAKHPSVTVVDSSGEGVIGDVRYLDLNTVSITFSAEISGEAYCN